MSPGRQGSGAGPIEAIRHEEEERRNGAQRIDLSWLEPPRRRGPAGRGDGGFPLKTEMKFLGGESVTTTTFKAPCAEK
jgi:hypothetical protein